MSGSKAQPNSKETTQAASTQKIMGSVPRSLGFKFFLLGVLIAILCIPLLVVWGLVSERESNYRRTTAEIGRQWGSNQTISGPLLAVPVIIENTVADGLQTSTRQTTQNVLIAPEALTITGKADTTRRERGNYEVIVYQSDLDIKARFLQPDLAKLSADIVSADWSRAKLVLSISDLKGIGAVSIERDGKSTGNVEPGYGVSAQSNGPRAGVNGLHTLVDLSSSFIGLNTPVNMPRDVEFDVALQLKGSQSLDFIPVGADTKVALTSNWLHPSFSGAFLPTSHDITDSGFEADWAVSKLARSIPQLGFENDFAFITGEESAFGVQFYQPVDFYRLVDRAVKYGVLFIGVAFLVIFTIELLSKGRMHAVHYTMVGLMVMVFYVLLLALAEYVGFTIAYLLAAGATGAVLASFVASVFKGRAATLAAFGSFAGLYGLLYVFLRLEDAALLAGALTGFVILSVMMFVTRKTDWSGADANHQD